MIIALYPNSMYTLYPELPFYDFLHGGSDLETQQNLGSNPPIDWPNPGFFFSNMDITISMEGVKLCPKQACIVKAMVVPVVMYRCESWTIKKAEGQRIDTFELWCWRRLLRVPWTARRSSQLILKEISPEYSLGGLLLKLKLQLFGHLMQRVCWKRP